MGRRTDDHTIADFDRSVAGNADTTGNDAVATDAGASRHPRRAADYRVSAYMAVVTNLNVVSETPVQTVLVLLAPTGDAHLLLLSTLARCLGDPGVRRFLKQKVSKERLASHLQSLVRPTP